MFRISGLVSLYFLAFLSLGVQADRQEDVTDYVIHIAHTLQKQHFGVFNCWLLQFANNSVKSPILNSIAQRLNNQHVSLLQANLHGPHMPTLREPNMVVILWANHQQAFNNFHTTQWIPNVPPECPTVILIELDETGRAFPWKIGEHFLGMKVFNTALIAINENAMFVFRYHPLRIARHSGFPMLTELFFDRLQTMQSKRLTVGLFNDYYTSSYCYKLPGEDMALFVLFAKNQQHTLRLQQLRCHTNESLAQCGTRYSHLNFTMNRFLITYYSRFTVSGITLEQFAIATPKGRLLTVWEIMRKPFQQSAWAVILAVLAVFQLLQQLKPALFNNNLVALALFGFDKRRLNLSKRNEKIVTCALITLFFQLKCAYEAKLVSYLTEAPHVPDAKSIADLRERNITVYYNSVNATEMSKLSGLVAIYRNGQFAFTGHTLLENRAALVAEKLFADRLEGYATPYTILPENVYEVLPFYIFAEKSPYVKRFHTFRQRTFEAGMQQHWRQTIFNCFVSYIISKHHSRERYGSSTGVISFDHLQPLMLFFVAQWALAIVVFGVEVLVGRCKRLRCGTK